MALTNTTTSAAVSATTLTIPVVSTSAGFPAVGVYSSRQLMRIDGEDMLINYVPVANTVKVLQRGYNGTAAVAHDTLAIVSTSSDVSDFLPVPVGAVNSRPPYVDDIVYLGQNTTFTAAGTAVGAATQPFPVKNTTYIITKASAASIILIATGETTPTFSAASIGLMMTFIAGTAAAHTVTYGPGFDGDTTTSDVATCNSKVGAALLVKVGHNGLLAAVNASTNASTGQWTLG